MRADRHGYSCCTHGDEVSPGCAQEVKERYSDVVLAPQFRQTIVRIKPDLAGAQVKQAPVNVTEAFTPVIDRLLRRIELNEKREQRLPISATPSPRLISGKLSIPEAEKAATDV